MKTIYLTDPKAKERKEMKAISDGWGARKRRERKRLPEKQDAFIDDDGDDGGLTAAFNYTPNPMDSTY